MAAVGLPYAFRILNQKLVGKFRLNFSTKATNGAVCSQWFKGDAKGKFPIEEISGNSKVRPSESGGGL